MAVLVEAQGQQLKDIESHVAHASSFVMRGTEQLDVAKSYQEKIKEMGLQACNAIVLGVFLVVVILFPVLSSTIIKNT